MLVVLALVAVAALGASLAGEENPQPPALAASSLCHAAFGKRSLNSAPESAERVRAFYVDPGGPRLAPQLRAARSRRFASLGLEATVIMGWCWVRNGPRSYEAYAVAPGRKPLLIEGIGGITRVPRPGPAPVI